MKRSCMLPLWVSATISLLAVFASATAAAQSVDRMAESLITLRGEVEQLNAEVEISREESRQQLAGLAAQRSELQANLQRQELARREIEDKLAEAQTRAAESGVAGETLKPVLLEAVAELRSHIQSSLPFKIDERLAELDEFRGQLDSGAVLPHRAANRLWAFYEDELRLTRENGIYSQTIDIGGQRLLVDIAKLGTVMMFFRTQDQRVGQARQTRDGWRFEYIEAADDRNRVLTLFDSLRKQIRQGWFELPYALSGLEVSQ